VLFAFLVVPLLVDEYMFRAILVPFLILSLAALGVNILVGYCGQITLGAGASMAVGAYAAYNFLIRVDGMPALARSCWAADVGRSGHRVRHPQPARARPVSRGGDAGVAVLLGLGLPAHQVVHQQFLVGFGFGRRHQSVRLDHQFADRQVPVLPRRAGRLHLMAKNLVRGNMGRQWMAIRDMDVAATVIGIRPMYAKLTAFAVSSFYLGVAGALWGFVNLGSWEPAAFSIDRSLQLLFMVIIGGMGAIVRQLLRRRLHRDPADLPQPDAAADRGAVRPGGLDRAGFARRDHGLRRADRLFPDRRTARHRTAVGDGQGKAAFVALPALNGEAGLLLKQIW
jgi:branched-chain amino acid transport system permease protein